MSRLPLLALLTFLLTGCPYGRVIPKGPHPLDPLNTEFDDYNIAAPPMLEAYVWSTNRGSRGGSFDLWTASGTFHEGFLELREDGAPRPFAATASPGNEFGPVYVNKKHSGLDSWSDARPIVFASDRAGGRGGLDLYRYDPQTGRTEPLAGLNGPANDAYFTRVTRYTREERGVPERTREFFASDRGGADYDIYEVRDGSVVRVAALCSDADDTAPFATLARDGSPVLLFASNRDAGRGGWDLYYAVFRKGSWTSPRNLGRRFNTPHNEFRPVWTQGALIFSSDRPGGKGGYDLYRARAPAFD